MLSTTNVSCVTQGSGSKSILVGSFAFCCFMKCGGNTSSPQSSQQHPPPPLSCGVAADTNRGQILDTGDRPHELLCKKSSVLLSLWRFWGMRRNANATPRWSLRRALHACWCVRARVFLCACVCV